MGLLNHPMALDYLYLAFSVVVGKSDNGRLSIFSSDLYEVVNATDYW